METFTGRAKKVFDAVLALNPDDRGMQLVAKEVARGVQNHDNGLGDSRLPIFGGILTGLESEYAPLKDIAFATAAALIGTPPNGILPLTYVDCSAFSSGHPFALAELIGPQEVSKETPRLFPGPIHQAHLLTKTYREMLPLVQWNQKITIEFPEIFSGQNPITQQIFSEEWGPIARKFEEIRSGIQKRNAPYNGVLLFEGLEGASPDLIGKVLTQILGNGVIFIPDQGFTIDFRNTIVFMTMNDVNRIGNSRQIGFQTARLATLSREARQKLYEDTKQDLLKDPRLGELARDVGDQIFLIGDRTPEAQRRHLVSHFLGDITYLFERVGVSVEFSPETIDLVLKESEARVNDRPVYFDGRLRKHVQKLIRTPLSIAVERGEIRKGADIVLTPDETGKIAVKLAKPGNGDIISGKDLEQKDSASETEGETLVEYPPEVRELDELARATIERIRSRKDQTWKEIKQQTSMILAQVELQNMQQRGPFGGFPGSQR